MVIAPDASYGHGKVSTRIYCKSYKIKYSVKGSKNGKYSLGNA
jgi:hypothetical protein